MNRWEGKVAIVTGASAGIGLALVQDLVKYGVITIALARRSEIIENVKAELPPSEAALLYPYKCDIADENDILETFQWIKETFGTVHIVVNNAGVITNASLLEGPSECWRKTLDVNILGLCMVTKEAFSLMMEGGVEDGHIININSIAGHKISNPALHKNVPVRLNVYPASKFAVTALTETIRMELYARKLKTKITSVSPGLTKTEIFSANEVDVNDDVFENPYIDAEQVSDAIIYVLSTAPNVNISELTIKPVGEAH